MPKTVTIVATNKASHGKAVILPGVGEVEISKDGEVEVSEETAEILVKNSPDWEYKNPPVEDESDDSEESDDNEENSGEDELSEEEIDKELTKTLIKKFDEEELSKLAKDSGVSKSVIGKAKTKADLVKMILNKLSKDDKKELWEANRD